MIGNGRHRDPPGNCAPSSIATWRWRNPVWPVSRAPVKMTDMRRRPLRRT